MKALGAFLTAAVISAILQTQLTACVIPGDCDCHRIPDRPEPQPELPILSVLGFTASGEWEEVPFDPTGGTLEVTGDRVIIRYEQDRQPRTVVYDVIGPGFL